MDIDLYVCLIAAEMYKQDECFQFRVPDILGTSEPGYLDNMCGSDIVCFEFLNVFGDHNYRWVFLFIFETVTCGFSYESDRKSY